VSNQLLRQSKKLNCEVFFASGTLRHSLTFLLMELNETTVFVTSLMHCDTCISRRPKDRIVATALCATPETRGLLYSVNPARAARAGVVLVTLASVALLLCGCHTPPATIVLRYRVRHMTIPREQLTNMNYLVQLPRGYEEDTNRYWPMVFYLHGIGESGNNPKKVLRFGPPRLVAQGKDLPCIVVSPQVPKGYFWFRESNMMVAILDEVMKTYRVDKRRVHVTGNSMGAFGAVVLAAREPERFASLVPVCGGVEYLDSLRLRAVPIWAFHGEKDPIVPAEESRRLVRLVNEIGGNARLTIYPDLGHNCWDRAYNDRALWDWILAQHK
jgi:pimeloyl-ACP methyl ester carboxylesterase